MITEVYLYLLEHKYVLYSRYLHNILQGLGREGREKKLDKLFLAIHLPFIRGEEKWLYGKECTGIIFEVSYIYKYR